MTIRDEANVMAQIPLFEKLSPAERQRIAFTSQLLDFEQGAALFRVGDSSDDVYFILTGRVEVVLNSNAGALVVREQGAPGLIGEMGVFRHAPRSATIRAMEPVKALRIKAETFLSFLSSNPTEARHVMRQLSEKLAVCHRQLEVLQASPQRSTDTP